MKEDLMELISAIKEMGVEIKDFEDKVKKITKENKLNIEKAQRIVNREDFSKSMVIYIVQNKKEIEVLRKDWALTFEGMSMEEDNLEEVFNWVEKYTKLKSPIRFAYVTSGKLMNESYGLHGNNAYPDDLNIFSIKLADIEDPNALAIPKMQVGARWMYDIVANNLRRERMTVKK